MPVGILHAVIAVLVNLTFLELLFGKLDVFRFFFANLVLSELHIVKFTKFFDFGMSSNNLIFLIPSPDS